MLAEAATPNLFSMSTSDKNEQGPQLLREEQQKVVDCLKTAGDAGKQENTTNEVSAEFKQLADQIFTTNAELFRKLAQ